MSPVLLQPPLRMTAFEYRDELDGGHTKPILIAAVDDAGVEHKMVLKVRQPDVQGGHYGPTSLACELICSILARSVGIGVPDYAVVDVPVEMPRAVPDARVRALLTANLGLNFGCRYHPGFQLWHPRNVAQSDALIGALEDIITLDSALLNGDREAGKPNLLFRGHDTLAIDHSLALFVHQMTDDRVGERLEMPGNKLRAHVAFGTVHRRQLPFARVCDALNSMEDSDLDTLRAMIPASWESTEGHLAKIDGFLKTRRQYYQAIRTQLREVAQ